MIIREKFYVVSNGEGNWHPKFTSYAQGKFDADPAFTYEKWYQIVICSGGDYFEEIRSEGRKKLKLKPFTEKDFEAIILARDKIMEDGLLEQHDLNGIVFVSMSNEKTFFIRRDCEIDLMSKFSRVDFQEGYLFAFLA